MMIEERPWGRFTTIYEENKIKIKIIEVNPGKRLSYQSHDHRKEKWVIIQGTAEVTLKGDVQIKSEGQIMEIGLKEKHRLANPGTIVLKIVEVQLGDYLGEDDITRYEDDFGRI